MHIKRKASAGTMQSSDLMVIVEPHDKLTVDIESTVKKQYEHLIRAQVDSVLKTLDISAGHIRVSDRGALDYAIAARVEAAVRRASED
jgi:citrate lyase subunit gamma (acyl carrier protein)